MDINNNSGIRFDEGTFSPDPFSRPSGLAGWIINHSNGRITTEAEANNILIGLFVIIIIVIITIFFILNRSPSVELPLGTEIIYPPKEPPRLNIPLL
ncbi:MAG: hypothetical protein COU90_00450 [Candidatus Ryanbacteria bacterium CG10_big_fil_rev_8_21_14_0_10_43_42]|uniref:Uncharacterized protein n=1 Tax=Candidatus Ryanbacteria bacterium CG10_big_fil_rev_8_21_14_0_10_43_42 TaxID=1974864 RepID=A0A2M8KXR6_9BACT|nr:MAG: hypothetical protein COU90_00450 [Candidatus Ryanbacteria bacterium CG10_big_fil_rev_8_21_14_0_10_43_42]